MSDTIGIKVDFPDYSGSEKIDLKSTTVAALRAIVQGKSGVQERFEQYQCRAVAVGEDVIALEEEEDLLAEAGVKSGVVLMFLAPLELKPSRGKTKAEQIAELKEEKKGVGFGYGKYSKYSLNNCFAKFRGEKKAEQKELCMEFICAKALDLFTKHEGYLRLSPDQLLEVLSFDSLNIPETELLGAVQLWGKTNKVKDTDMAPFLANIRFPCMNITDITALDLKLSDDERLKLYTHTALPIDIRPRELEGFTTAQCTPRVPMFMGAIFEKFGSKITVDEDKRTAKYSGSSNWQGSAICTPCDKFSFKITGPCSNLMAGFSTPDLKLEGNNYSQGKGYYLYLNNWSLYGVGKSGSSYTSGSNSIGTIVTCEYDSDAKEVKFYLNGLCKGVAFSGVTLENLVPAFDFYDNGSSVELCEDPDPQ